MLCLPIDQYINMKFLQLLVFLCFFSTTSNAQLADGSVAPNFTLTDIDGNTHTLYDYLAAGKMVVLDFSATWCAPCWSYHNSGALENLYTMYGPGGTNEVMVLMIEGDLNTDMEDLLGNDPASQGNWIDGTPYPIIDLQTNAVTSAYQISYWPTIYTISPYDNTIYEAGQSGTETQYSWLQSFTLDVTFDQAQDAFCYGDGSASVNVTGGATPYSYSWSNGSNAPVLEGVGGGVYTVTVTEGNGVQQVISDIVIDGPGQPYVISELIVEDVACFSDASGTAEVTVTGGNVGYSYAWSNGDTEAIAEGLVAGTYAVSIYDANNCLIEQTLTINEPSLLESSSSSTSEACDMSNGSLEIAVDGGTSPYDILVSGPTGNFITSDFTLENMPAGTYELAVIDANGCVNNLTQTIDFIEGPTVEAIGDLVLSCSVSEIVLDANIIGGSGDFDYFWTTQDGNIVGSTDGISIVVNQPGQYDLLIVDISNGCEANTYTDIYLDQNTPVAIATADAPGISCVQTVVNLSAFGSSTGQDILYSWLDVLGNAFSSDLEVTVSEPGVYTLSVTNVANGCQTLQTITVPDNRDFVVPNYMSSISELTVQFNDSSTGNPGNWSWVFGDGGTSTEQNPTHLFAISGTYNVCMTATNDCGSETICNDIIVQSAGAALSAFGNSIDISCNGLADGSIDLNVSGGTSPYTYNWTGEDGFESTTRDVMNLKPGSYSVVITDADNNMVTNSFDIVEPTPVVVDGFVTDNDCYGDATGMINLNVTVGVAPYTYSWANISSTVSELLIGATAGDYEVIVTDANACIQSLTYTVSEPDSLSITEVVIYNEQNATELGSISLVINGGTTPYSFSCSNGSAETKPEQCCCRCLLSDCDRC